MTPRFTLRRALSLGAALAALTSVLGPSAHATTTPGPTAPVPVPDDAAVRFTFDGPNLLADLTGHGHDLTPVSRHGGDFDTIPHGDGRALMFPSPCHHEPCPRIALRAVTARDLDPGTRPIRWGATVLLGADRTTKGENVLQKGYSASGSQYKLQIDGLPGDPSCVMVDDDQPEIYLAKSDVSVADGRWHAVECRRAGGTLVVLVDGVQRGETAIPADLSVRNRLPLSVGGKGSFTDNDQFQGALDDVWVAISRPFR